jgi:hypothetical protein
MTNKRQQQIPFPRQRANSLVGGPGFGNDKQNDKSNYRDSGFARMTSLNTTTAEPKLCRCLLRYCGEADSYPFDFAQGAE